MVNDGGMSPGFASTVRLSSGEVDEPVVAVHVGGFTLEMKRHLDFDRLVPVDPKEVDVGHHALDRIALQIAHDRELVGAVDLERDERVVASGPRQRMA